MQQSQQFLSEDEGFQFQVEDVDSELSGAGWPGTPYVQSPESGNKQYIDTGI
jgi:hypothetical protein